MINFVNVNGKDLFTDDWGQYRYVNAKYTSIDTANEQVNDNQKIFYRGSVAIEGDSVPTRRVMVFKTMLKDIKEGDQGLTRVRVFTDRDGNNQLSLTFSYGEGGQNVITEESLINEWGFAALEATETVPQDEPIGG